MCLNTNIVDNRAIEPRKLEMCSFSIDSLPDSRESVKDDSTMTSFHYALCKDDVCVACAVLGLWMMCIR